MDYYLIWFNLKDSRKDLETAKAIGAYLGKLQEMKRIEGWSLARRKLGFGPESLGEFHAVVRTRDLAQLDEAFRVVAPREGEVQQLHHAVYENVVDFKSALYRDFPDPGRTTSLAGV